MSVELPLWRGIVAFRLLALVYALARYAADYTGYVHPAAGWVYMAVLTLWTLATARSFLSAARCSWPLLWTDMALAVTGVILTRLCDDSARVVGGATTLPTIWAAGTVLGFAAKGGWRPAALAATVIGASNI